MQIPHNFFNSSITGVCKCTNTVIAVLLQLLGAEDVLKCTSKQLKFQTYPRAYHYTPNFHYKDEQKRWKERGGEGTQCTHPEKILYVWK